MGNGSLGTMETGIQQERIYFAETFRKKTVARAHMYTAHACKLFLVSCMKYAMQVHDTIVFH